MKKKSECKWVKLNSAVIGKQLLGVISYEKR